MTRAIVTSEVDLYSPDVVADPYPVLAGLRELGSAVYMSKYDFWLLPRYAEVREASNDWKAFTSKHGVALREEFNEFLKGSALASDPPEHDRLRAILYDKLTPRALASAREEISGLAGQLAAEVIARGQFDACEDIAFVFPITVISDLVGLPLEGRERFRPGADASFAGFGPVSEYLAERYGYMKSYQDWMETMADASKLTPGGWGAAIMEAVAEGRISQKDAIMTLSAYMTAGMDTTVNAISALFHLFAERPDVWTAVRKDPALIRPATNEILRLESPVTGFFRITTRDIEFGDAAIPKGARVMLHWGSANRDPRHYQDPDSFDLQRQTVDHLAFGYGEHVCPGRALAMMEIAALVEAFISRVERFDLAGTVVMSGNPVVHGREYVPLSVKILEG